MEKINYNLAVQVAGGPVLSMVGVLEVDAYEKIDVMVPAKAAAAAGKLDVTVSPADLNATRLVIIQSSINDGSLKYKGSGAGAADVAITGPLTLLSQSACSLLGTKPDKLTFTIESATPATVTILVGRKAVA